MKLYLAIFLLFPFYLFAQVANKQSSFENGISYYKNKEFTKSYAIFSKIYLQNLSNVKFNFYFGRSAYETGHYEMALASFERVAMQDESNLRNRLEMARTYFMLKMYEDAQNAFEDVLANPNIPQNIRTNIELSLSQVSKVQQKSFTYTRAMIGLLYDSNINYGSIGDYQYGGNTLSKIEAESDFALEFYTSIVNIYDIGNKNGFALKNSFFIYTKEYFNYTDYTTSYLAYTPSILYRETSYMAELALTYDVLFLDHKKYLQTISLTPSIQYNHSTTLSSLLHIKYQKKQFIQEVLDANRYELSYGLQNILSPRSYIQGNMFIIKESKISGNDIYVDYTEYKTNLSYTNLFSSTFGVDLYAQVRLRQYLDFSTGFGSTREDVGALMNGSFNLNIFPTLQANLKLNYEYVDSNQDRFTYDKYTIFAGITKTF